MCLKYAFQNLKRLQLYTTYVAIFSARSGWEFPARMTISDGLGSLAILLRIRAWRKTNGDELIIAPRSDSIRAASHQH